ncbi:DrmE family protein [Eubacteriales bacterium OttesenSCG-928-G02]|nr:DrmE family protein [Eubacteriales bacterium OttesenSCG-928-G02]
MLWSDYILSMLERETALDNLAISIDSGRFAAMPAVLKASILLTNQLLKPENKSMLVFPEQRTCSFIFMLLRTLYNIAEGKVSRTYDPYKFIPGEKLKFKNSVVEFVGIEAAKEDGRKRIFVKFVDGMRLGMPLETAPFLQHVQTKRLSKFEAFSKEYYPFLKEQSLSNHNAFLSTLPDYKTHLDCSSVFVAPILSTKNLLLKTFLDNERLSDLLLLAQADVDGKISRMTAGQLSGTPAIVLCQDLYTVCAAIESGLSVNEVFIEANQTIVDHQLDAIDELTAKGKSIILLSDQASFNDFSGLESRGFRIWTWNENTITHQLYQGSSALDIRVKNSGAKKIRYKELLCPELSCSISLLYKNMHLIEEQAVAVVQIFQDLFEITLAALRTVTPLTNKVRAFELLERVKAILEQEKDYLKVELFEDLCTVQSNLTAIYSTIAELPKVGALIDLLKNINSDKIYIIVPQKADKTEIEQFLLNLDIVNIASLNIVYPNEYNQLQESSTGLTVVSGWLNKNMMHRILHANITSEIITLVYEAEKRWKNGYVRNNLEQQKRSNDLNASILSSIDNSIADDFKASTVQVRNIRDIKTEECSDSSDLDKIELTLRQNKYRGYFSTTGNDSVPAIPVSFVGDLIAFYRTSRRLLTATKLINEDYDKVEEISPEEIQTGDFIVERESQRDLIRDIADIILKNSDSLVLREIAHKWKDTLEVESVFSDEDTIYEKLLNVGCTRGKMTIHNWLTDDDMITPQSKDDIVYIAKATDDSVLLEMVEQVFSAGRTIKSAHIQAGHHLADKLRINLADALAAEGSIDGFNVWQPLEVEIENIGAIKLLKVIDVGSEVLVDTTSTNRLIDTNRVGL